jgi:uncharacterized protein (TIGR00369 family)
MTGSAADAVGDLVDRHPYLDWLGVEVVSAGDGEAVVTLPADDSHRNLSMENPQTIHGGIIATLVDNATGIALRTTFDDPASAKLTTTNLDVNYLRPATDDVTATAEVRRSGGSIGVADVDLTTGAGAEEALVAVGRTTFRLFRGED